MKVKAIFRLSAAVLALVFFSSNVDAQDYGRFEVSASVGGAPWLLGSVGGNDSGASIVMEFKYTPVKYVSFSLLGGYHGFPYEEIKGNCNLMASVYVNWYTGYKFKVYSGLGYGSMAGYVNSGGNQSYGVQITLAGITFGRRFFGFAEVCNGWMCSPVRAGAGFRF